MYRLERQRESEVRANHLPLHIVIWVESNRVRYSPALVNLEEVEAQEPGLCMFYYNTYGSLPIPLRM